MFLYILMKKPVSSTQRRVGLRLDFSTGFAALLVIHNYSQVSTKIYNTCGFLWIIVNSCDYLLILVKLVKLYL